MWPWEHLAFGYLAYSLALRSAGRRPRGGPVLLLALGTQLPDLIDKPLGWQFDVFATGVGAAHSVLVAGPVLVLLLAGAVRTDRTRYGFAFVTGYASHLVGDVLNALRRGAPPEFGKVLWPAVQYPDYARDLDLFGRFFYYLGEFLAVALRPENAAFVGVYLLTFALVGLLWLVDGAPGVRTVVRFVVRGGRRATPDGR